ncbi:polysaccharide deacetylase, partial [Klebsiella pneumoniae]|nr:polysaccharide deacetylase [Klebsiella pneumoniae]
AVFPLTIHPDVSGKPHVLKMHERIFDHIRQFEGVKFVTMEEIAADFSKRYPRSGTARPQS